MKDEQYFIDKYTAIPKERWTTCIQINEYGQRCALGHLMREDAQIGDMYGNTTDDGKALGNLFYNIAKKHSNFYKNHPSPEQAGVMFVAGVNNGWIEEYNQRTPKERILAALHDIRTERLQESALNEAKHVLDKELCPV